MKKSLFILPVLALALACQRPEVEAFRQHPVPLSVTVILPNGLPQEVRQDYAAALRARLATRITVVPEDVPAPAGSVELEVLIQRIREGRGHSDPSPTAVGVATGAAVGLMSAASGNRGHSILDGIFWGIWAGVHASEAARHDHRRLGYNPSKVQAQITLKQGGSPVAGRNPVLYEFDLNGYEVMEAMDPLSRADSEDPSRVREEEARAFARVVTRRLQDKFGWLTQSKPSFYQSPDRKEKAEAPKPETPQ